MPISQYELQSQRLRIFQQKIYQMTQKDLQKKTVKVNFNPMKIDFAFPDRFEGIKSD